MNISVFNETKRFVGLEHELESNLEKFLVKTADSGKNYEVAALIVSKETMLEYVHKHLNESGEVAQSHPVLSFVQTEIEGEFVFPPDNVTHLGEIIVSADHAKDFEELSDLAIHGLMHLLGIHHE